MGLLDGLLGFTPEKKEEMVREIVQDTLERLSIELQCDPSEVLVIIKPRNSEFEPRFDVYLQKQGTPPKHIRELTAKDVIGEE